MLIVIAALSLAGELLAQPAPLNSSVLIFDEATLDRAPAMVDRCAELGNRRVMVVVTVHCRLTPELRVKEYGLVGDRRLQWKAPLHPGNFFPMNDERRRSFTKRLAAVFRRAARRGMDLAVLPHLDAYGEVEEWRNRFDFDPIARRSGESYETAVVTPIVDALAAAIRPATRVQLSVSGEMGQSFFTHAAFYDELGAYARRRLGAGRVEIGVSLNHNELAGGARPTPAQRAAAQRFVNRCDFVGLSHYRPFEPPPRVEHFTKACDAFVAALAGLGVTPPPETPLHLSEVAIGGAPPKSGPATPTRASAEPWEGTGDPKRDPWRRPEMRSLRRRYHRELLTFLATQPASRRVSVAYLWSEGSWDPQGIDGRRFVDREIVEAIEEHNRAARR